MAKREGFIPNIKVKDAEILGGGWRGFGPNGDKYHRRGFQLKITDEDMANDLIEMGWNLHIMPARDESEDVKWRLPVEIRFGDYPPEVVMVTRRGGEVRLDDDTIGTLDRAHIDKINVEISPSKYDPDDFGGRGTGVKAWLRKMKVWISEDETMDDDESPWD